MSRFRRYLFAAALLSGGVLATASAQAAPPLSGDPVRAAADQLDPTANAQYFWRGRRYCWYWDGWRGPGWYWCGYRWRRGYGWGGGYGWHGWRHHGWRGHHRQWRGHRDMRGPRPGFRGGFQHDGRRGMRSGPVMRGDGPRSGMRSGVGGGMRSGGGGGGMRSGMGGGMRSGGGGGGMRSGGGGGGRSGGGGGGGGRSIGGGGGGGHR